MPFINVSPFHEFLSGMNFILQINVGVVKLTGEAGTGKTTLLQELARDTTKAYQDLVIFYSAPSSFEQIKNTIREQLGLDASINFHDALLNYLLAKPDEQRRLIVVFDEAEQMDEDTLLALTHLRSVQHVGHHLIGMVLCGRPELDRLFRKPEHRALARDILLSYELSPLSSQQLPDFCRACLAARGLDSFVLVSDDYMQIMQKSGGLPGKVAELVETYWPEDPDISEPSAAIPGRELPASEITELQTEPVAEATAAELKPALYAPPARGDVTFDVSPVISPDISEVLAAAPSEASSGVSPDLSTGILSNVSADIPASIKSDNSHVAAPFVPAVDQPPGLTRHRIIAGALFAAVVIVAIVVSFVRRTDPGTAEAETFANVEPAPTVPAQPVPADAIPTVNVQQFGTAAADNAAIDVTSPAPAATEQSTEVVPQPLVADAPADVPADTTAPPPAPAAVSPQTLAIVAARAASPDAIATAAQATVTAWTNAWQNQDVLAYLAFYHRDFVPPNQASRETWANSRTRTITSQSSILITVEDFQVVNNSADQTTVQFLLTYRGDSYADRTVKQLVLQPDTNGELRILQEQNLQTEVFDPVIEDAASWMVDRTPDALTASSHEKREPIFSQVEDNHGVMAATRASDARPSAAPVLSELENVDAPAFPAEVTVTIPLIFNLTSLSQAEVQQIHNFLLQWAQAWQSQDTELYLRHYHPDYKAPELPTIAAWREERIRKITAQGHINISLNELEILENNSNSILVELLLEYHADAYADRTLKRMLLSRTAAGRWLISAEKNLEVEKL